MRTHYEPDRQLAGSEVFERLDENAPRPAAGTPQPLRISPAVVLGLLRFGEAFLIAAVGLAVWHLYVGDYSARSLGAYLPVILLAGTLLPAAFQVTGLYTVHALLGAFRHLARVASGWSLFFGLVLAYVFFTKAGVLYSRVWLASWFLLGLAALMALRLAAAAFLRRWNRDGRLDRRAVIVGGGEPGAELIRAIEASSDSDIAIVGIFDDRGEARSPDTVAGYAKLGNVATLVEFARTQRVDLLIVTLPLHAETRLLEILKKLWVLPVDIRLSAYTQKLRFRPRSYSFIGSVPLFDVLDKPLSEWDWMVKAIEDRLIAAALLVLLAPVLALTALAVRLDSRGPVLFRQKRYGFNNELVEVYKFRSMHDESSDPDATRLATRNDPRITRVGRLIRKTSLDELPQLFNVLKGDLSLVGPRPHATKAKVRNRLYFEVVDSYYARHKVKPGITGWAQINGWRGETDTIEKIQRRVGHDLYYIENWSVAFDLYILLMTPWALFKTENAY